MTTTTETKHAKVWAIEIAQHMPDWVAKAEEDDFPSWLSRSIEHKYMPARIFISKSRKPTHLHISGSCTLKPVDGGSQSYFASDFRYGDHAEYFKTWTLEINVAKSKGAKAIASEIDRRLLPSVFSFVYACQDRHNQHTKFKNDTESALKSVANSLGVEIVKSTNGSGSTYFEPYAGPITLDYSGPDKVRIKLELTTKQWEIAGPGIRKAIETD